MEELIRAKSWSLYKATSTVLKGIRENDSKALEKVSGDYKRALSKAKSFNPTIPFIDDLDYECKVIEQMSEVVRKGEFGYHNDKIKEIISSEKKIKSSTGDSSLFRYFSTSLATAMKENNEEKKEELRDMLSDTILENKEADKIIDRLYTVLLTFLNSD